MGRSIRVDRLEMYKFYFLGMRTDQETSLSIVDPITREVKHFSLPTYKRASYRDVARHFGYSVRQVEKIGKKYKWYLQRKYFHLKVMNRLPWDKEWIYKS